MRCVGKSVSLARGPQSGHEHAAIWGLEKSRFRVRVCLERGAQQLASASSRLAARGRWQQVCFSLLRARNRSLTYLDLSRNSIGDQGVLGSGVVSCSFFFFADPCLSGESPKKYPRPRSSSPCWMWRFDRGRQPGAQKSPAPTASFCWQAVFRCCRRIHLKNVSRLYAYWTLPATPSPGTTR